MVNSIDDGRDGAGPLLRLRQQRTAGVDRDQARWILEHVRLQLRDTHQLQVPQSLPGNYYNPCSDDALVVYQGGRAGGYDDIYLYDTGNGTVRQLTHNSDPGDGNDWNPRLDNGRMVWEKHMLGLMAKSGIYVYDMNKGKRDPRSSRARHTTTPTSGETTWSPSRTPRRGTPPRSSSTTSRPEIQIDRPCGHRNDDPPHRRGVRGLVVGRAPDRPSTTPGTPTRSWVYDIATGNRRRPDRQHRGNFNPSIVGGVIAWEQGAENGIGRHVFRRRTQRSPSARAM